MTTKPRAEWWTNTDTDRLDFLEREILAAAERGESACVVLAAWFSGPGKADGFSFASGEYIPDPNEWPSLREAIDDAMDGQAGPPPQPARPIEYHQPAALSPIPEVKRRP